MVCLNKDIKIFTECRDVYCQEGARLLGFACMLIFMSKRYSLFQIATLNLWIQPAIHHKQIVFLFNKDSVPMGYVTWAHLAPDSQERLLNDPDFLLHPSEWNEGGNTWIIDFCFPCGNVRESIKKIKWVLKCGGITRVHWARRYTNHSIRRVGKCNLVAM